MYAMLLDIQSLAKKFKWNFFLEFFPKVQRCRSAYKPSIISTCTGICCHTNWVLGEQITSFQLNVCIACCSYAGAVLVVSYKYWQHIT